MIIEIEDTIDKDKISVRFEEQGLEVLALSGQTLWVLSIPKLYKKIIPDRCKYKVGPTNEDDSPMLAYGKSRIVSDVLGCARSTRRSSVLR